MQAISSAYISSTSVPTFLPRTLSAMCSIACTTVKNLFSAYRPMRFLPAAARCSHSISLRKASTPSSITTSLRFFPTGSRSPSQPETYQQRRIDIGLKCERRSGGFHERLFEDDSGDTKTGTYPLYVVFYPSAHFSRLHLDGLRPTGGLQGTGSLCTSRGVVEALKLSGTVYGGWSSTNDALMEFRLLEIRVIDVGQRQGYFDLYGRWRGTALVMDDRNRANG